MHTVIDSHGKCESYVMISVTVRPSGRVSVCGKNFKVEIFLDTINMINVKLCMIVVLIELNPFIPLQ